MKTIKIYTWLFAFIITGNAFASTVLLSNIDNPNGTNTIWVGSGNALDLTVTKDVNLLSVEYILYGNSFVPSVSIYADNAGSVGAELLTVDDYTVTGNIYSFQTADKFTFSAGETYWIGLESISGVFHAATSNIPYDGIGESNSLRWGTAYNSFKSPCLTDCLAVEVTGQLSPVPLPAAAWLFGSALIGFIGFRQFKSEGA